MPVSSSPKELARVKGRRKWIAKGPNHLLDREVLAAACVHDSWQPSFRSLSVRLGEQARRGPPPRGRPPGPGPGNAPPSRPGAASIAPTNPTVISTGPAG